ncbi:MAG: hypothetical protein IPP57_04165 [Candidatus Obscuribacter sp.]|nr:hypothetical protein [Candidatus Obscuribacter sp.]
MPKVRPRQVLPDFEAFYWSYFEDCKAWRNEHGRYLKCAPSNKFYKLEESLSTDMLEKFLGVRDEVSCIAFLELFGLPVRLTQSFGDLSVEDMISLAATCRAIQLLIDLSNDEAASLDMYVNHSIVMPTDACMAALYNLSQSEPLIKYLKNKTSTDFWIVFFRHLRAST